MRNLMFLVLLVAAIIVSVLYLKRMNTGPVDVQRTLGDSVTTMQQVPQAVRDKVTADMEKAQKRLDEAQPVE
jgi:hypothetical protein